MEWVKSILVKKPLEKTCTVSTATNNECYQETRQKVILFLIKVGSQMLEVFNSFQLRQLRGSQ